MHIDKRPSRLRQNRVIGHFVLVLVAMKLDFIWLHRHFKLFG